MDSQKNTTNKEKKDSQNQVSNCKKHGDYKAEYIGFGDFKRLSPCPECQKEYEEGQKKREELEKKEKISDLKRDSGIGKRYFNIKLDDFICDKEEQQKIYNVMKKYVSNYQYVISKGISFIFSGNPGTGKTFLACSVANNLMENFIKVKYVSIFLLMSRIKATFDKSNTDTELKVINEYIGCDFLILDEIGVQTGSDYEKSILFQIINSRYEMVKPTILITNLNANDSEKIIGERIVDRFFESGGGFYNFDWESHRRKRDNAS